MSLPRGLWDRHIALLTGIADVPRPVVVAEVTDLSRYTTSGAGYVGVTLGGSLLWAVYRDGPAPALGDLLQIKRGDAPLDARWYAWPLPYAATCLGVFYVSAREVTTGAWAILRFSLVTGHWEYRSASPVAGSFAQRPLISYGGTRLLTWGRDAAATTPGPVYYSDDGAATWTACGIEAIALTPRTKHSGAWAVDGTSVYRSADLGATWASAYPLAGGAAIHQQPSALTDNVAILTASGLYIDYFPQGDHVDYGPYTPGGTRALFRAGDHTLYRGADGAVYDVPDTTLPDTTTATALGFTLPGAPDSNLQLFDVDPWYSAAGAGNGQLRRDPFSGGGAVEYDNDTQHPHGLTGIGVRDMGLVTGLTAADWPIASNGYTQECLVIALDDDAPGVAPHTKFALRTTDGLTWGPIDGTMQADVGGIYRASAQGITTLELWGVLEVDG